MRDIHIYQDNAVCFSLFVHLSLSFPLSFSHLTPNPPPHAPLPSVSPCELHCRPVNEGFSEKMLDAVTDGTPCFMNNNSRNICVNGVCKVSLMERERVVERGRERGRERGGEREW